MSESRNSSESRYTSRGSSYSYSSESRNSGESRATVSSTQQTSYNSIAEIDEQIELLEVGIPNVDLTNPRIAKVISERQNKIAALKKLKAKAIRQANEDKIIRQLEKENQQAQRVINNVKNQYVKSNTATNYSSESRNSGESRY